jgi:hypothetical protein
MEGVIAWSMQALRRSKVIYFLPGPSAFTIIRIWGSQGGKDLKIPYLAAGTEVACQHVRTRGPGDGPSSHRWKAQTASATMGSQGQADGHIVAWSHGFDSADHARHQPYSSPCNVSPAQGQAPEKQYAR